MVADSGGLSRAAALQENVSVFNSDRSAWVQTLAEDAVLQTDPAWPDGGRFEGRAAIAQFMGQFDEAWSSASFEIHDAEEIGEAVVTRGRWVVRGTSSGAGVEVEFSLASTLSAGGQLQSAALFFDHAEALAFARENG
jgi:ketosteroid isomerase-like protein